MSAAQAAAVREALAGQVANQSAGIRAQEGERAGSVSDAEKARHVALAQKASALEEELKAKSANTGKRANAAARPNPDDQPGAGVQPNRATQPGAAPQADPAKQSQSAATPAQSEEARSSQSGASSQTVGASQHAPRTSSAGKAGAPSDANNLAMVRPLKYETRDGMPFPVMKAPETTHVPVVTTSQRKVRAGRARRAGRRARQEVSREQLQRQLHKQPVQAANAHGLEPLSAAERERTGRKKYFAALGVLLVLGLGTLATGVVLIVLALHR